MANRNHRRSCRHCASPFDLPQIGCVFSIKFAFYCLERLPANCSAIRSRVSWSQRLAEASIVFCPNPCLAPLRDQDIATTRWGRACRAIVHSTERQFNLASRVLPAENNVGIRETQNITKSVELLVFPGSSDRLFQAAPAERLSFPHALAYTTARFAGGSIAPCPISPSHKSLRSAQRRN